jgi:hypothetical protein
MYYERFNLIRIAPNGLIACARVNRFARSPLSWLEPPLYVGASDFESSDRLLGSI